jgi:hypothetical protein
MIWRQIHADLAAEGPKTPDLRSAVRSLVSSYIITFLSRPIVEVLKQKTGLSITYDENFYKSRVEFITNMVFDGIKEHSK